MHRPAPGLCGRSTQSRRRSGCGDRHLIQSVVRWWFRVAPRGDRVPKQEARQHLGFLLANPDVTVLPPPHWWEQWSRATDQSGGRRREICHPCAADAPPPSPRRPAATSAELRTLVPVAGWVTGGIMAQRAQVRGLALSSRNLAVVCAKNSWSAVRSSSIFCFLDPQVTARPACSAAAQAGSYMR